MNIGDIVMLKSGSPDLTISEVANEEGYVRVTWFDDDRCKFETYRLPSAALRFVAEDEPAQRRSDASRALAQLRLGGGS